MDAPDPESPPTERALRPHELPAAVQGFVRRIGREPRRADDQVLVAEDQDMAYAVIETPDGYRLDHPSIRPPLDGDTIIDGASLADVGRLLVAGLGDRLPWVPGTARHGLPRGLPAEERLDRVRGVSLERLAEAYLDGSPEGVLERLAEPAALDLLTDELLAKARGHRWTLLPTDGPDGVRLTDGDVDLVLRREGDSFVLARRPERSNTVETLHRGTDLEVARAQLRAALR